jgi:3-oxoacyl-[acyl-carrier-protein] synthase II
MGASGMDGRERAWRRRVAVTGIGLVTPVGIGVGETWSALVEGRSGIDRLTRFDSAGLETHIGGEVKGFDPTRWISERDARTMDRFVQLAIAGAGLAFADAGLTIDEETAERAGCYVGVALGGSPMIESTVLEVQKRGPRFGVSPFFLPAVLPNMAAGLVASRFNLKGPNVCTATACAAGAHAIGEAARAIQRGDVDVALAGGAESSLNLVALGGFAAVRALSKRNDTPREASRPFERDRDGFVMSEGAGLLVLEDMDRARARNARIYAELAGYAATCDAGHPTAPAANGDGARRCMRSALRDAGLGPEDVDYINAHGTSTKMNDQVETLAIKAAFGESARAVMVSSTKSMTGHMLGAAGGVEAAVCALALREGVVPPTINHVTPDPACDLDYVPNEARRVRVRAAMSNSFGFGGSNATLILTQAS